MDNKRAVVYLSQLRDVQVLWDGDFRAFAEFVLRSRDASDKIVNAQNRGYIQKSRPTLQMLAHYFSYMTEFAAPRIERLLKDHGFDIGATVDFDIIKLVKADF
jgi:hypothetical protein